MPNTSRLQSRRGPSSDWRSDSGRVVVGSIASKEYVVSFDKRHYPVNRGWVSSGTVSGLPAPMARVVLVEILKLPRDASVQVSGDKFVAKVTFKE